MNLGSWIVLAIVLVCVGFAIKVTFFKKKARGGCCDTGDALPACCQGKQETAKRDAATCGTAPGSPACEGCDGCSAARFTLQPTIREIVE